MAKKLFKKTEEAAPIEEPVEASVEQDEETTAEPDEAPKAGLVSRTAYKVLYVVSYGAVFSSLLVAKLLIPKDSVVEKALHDGAVAARHDFEEKAQAVVELVAETAERTEDILSGESHSAEDAPAVPA